MNQVTIFTILALLCISRVNLKPATLLIETKDKKTENKISDIVGKTINQLQDKSKQTVDDYTDVAINLRNVYNYYNGSTNSMSTGQTKLGDTQETDTHGKRDLLWTGQCVCGSHGKGALKNLLYHEKTLSSATPTNCIKYCGDNGYNFAGLNFKLGNPCLCGYQAPPLIKMNTDKPCGGVHVYRTVDGAGRPRTTYEYEYETDDRC